MRRYPFLTVLINIALAAACSGTSNSNSNNASQAATPDANKSEQASADLEKRVQANAELVEMVRANNAVVQWEGELVKPYTINLQSALQRKDKRPILFFGFLDDIVKNNGKTIATFAVFPRGHGEGRFRIECNQIEAMAMQGEDYDEYAVVANVSLVTRPLYAVKAKSKSETEAELELQAPTTFIAMGRCVGFIRLPPKSK